MWQKKEKSKKTISFTQVDPTQDLLKTYENLRSGIYLHEKNGIFYPSKYFVEPKIQNGDYIAHYTSNFDDRPDYSLKNIPENDFQLFVIQDMKPKKVEVKVPGALFFINDMFIHKNVLHIFYQEAVYSTVIGDENYGKFSSKYYDEGEEEEEEKDDGKHTDNENFLTIEGTTVYMLPRDINAETVVISIYSLESREIIQIIDKPIKDIWDSTPRIFALKDNIMIHDNGHFEKSLMVYDKSLTKIDSIVLKKREYFFFGCIDNHFLSFKINLDIGEGCIEILDDSLKESICSYKLIIDKELNDGWVNDSFKADFYLDGIFIHELNKHFRVKIQDDVYSFQNVTKSDMNIEFK